MSYWKVTTAVDGIPLYAWADSDTHAIRVVSAQVGENTKNGRTLYRAAACEAPGAGAWVIGEPADKEVERNREEEF